MSDEPFYAPGKKIEPDRPALRPTLETLWTVFKDQHVMTCLIVEAPVGEELRVLVDGEDGPDRDSSGSRRARWPSEHLAPRTPGTRLDRLPAWFGIEPGVLTLTED